MNSRFEPYHAAEIFQLSSCGVKKGVSEFMFMFDNTDLSLCYVRFLSVESRGNTLIKYLSGLCVHVPIASVCEIL